MRQLADSRAIPVGFMTCCLACQSNFFDSNICFLDGCVNRLLKTFVAVSFSLAVSRVHESQGAISTQIAKLEEQAGIKLIDRSQRHFRLTEAGEIFLTFAKETLAKAQQLKRLFEELNAGRKGEIRIGATRSVGIYVLPDIIRGLAKEFPGIKLSLFPQSRMPIYEIGRA